MDREPVSSSSLVSVGYDPTSEKLEVEFKSGLVYEYYNVPQFVYDQLMQAPSIGAFFNAQVRNSFASGKV